MIQHIKSLHQVSSQELLRLALDELDVIARTSAMPDVSLSNRLVLAVNSADQAALLIRAVFARFPSQLPL